MGRTRLIHLIWPLLLTYLSYVMQQLAFFDSLSSVANDSVNYLAMARHYSPWIEETNAIKSVWPLQDFPPLFPLFLAISGAAHSLFYAHVLVVVTGFSSLYFLYRLSVGLSVNRIASVGLVLLFALSPGYLLGLQGILSEALYLLLSLAFLSYYQLQQAVSKWRVVWMGLLLAAILLTRTIGYALLAAVIAQNLIEYFSSKKMPTQAMQIASIGLAGAVVFMWLLGPERESHYPSVIQNIIAGNEAGLGLKGLAVQLQSILNAWQSHWIIYWVSELSITYLAALCLLLVAVLGWSVRLKANRVDAWYVLFYLLILVIWPHPGQMLRLLLPVVPVLLIYAFNATLRVLTYIPDRKKSNFLMIFLYGILLVSVLPAHAFIHGRLALAESEGMIPVYEIFRKPDVAKANRDLFIQNQMFKDFTCIGEQMDSDGMVLYYMPAYLAVLGNEMATKLTYPAGDRSHQGLTEMYSSGFILLTALHPRKTREGIDGFAGEESLGPLMNKIWCSYSRGTEEAVSCLYKTAK